MSLSVRLGVRSALVDGEVVAGDVSVADGVIQAVGLAPGESATAIAVPGFVDWQVNGFAGVHFGAADENGYRVAAEALANAGIVFCAPTLLSMNLDGYRAALGELRAVRAADPTCGFTGAHLEGPFLSPKWMGAHEGDTFLADPGVTLDGLLAAGPIAMMTVAPELPGLLDAVRRLDRAGVRVSIGHTDATAETCAAAEAQGARAMTHCWNAHRRFSARDPGPAGWALASSRATVGLIADGVHVAPEVMALTFAAAPGRVALTTDAIAPSGTGEVSWDSSRGRVSISDGAPRLVDGTLCGSVATPSSMLRLLENAEVGFACAVDALSRPQAAMLGLGEWRMRPGDPAHITALAEDHSVQQAWRFGSRIT